jgi:3-deoxy-manno-octulosonate cytidylyltransferase (CMP-KDO synthetase)
MNNVVIIPARMGSSRFPGKPLINILGLPMVIHVWFRCKMSKEVDEVYIATCDKKIQDICLKYGAKVIMTSKKHKMCMDRVVEASKKIKAKNIITVQGDEPLIQPKDIDLIAKKLKKIGKNETINLIQKIKLDKEINDPNRVKVVLNKKKEIIYISRETIPSRKLNKEFKSYYKLGNVYAMKKSFLKIYSNLKASNLEMIESIDMNRIIDYNYKLKSLLSNSNLVSIDVPKDKKTVIKLMKKDHTFFRYKKI